MVHRPLDGNVPLPSRPLSSSSTDLKRRRFLLALGASGVGAATAAAAAAPAPDGAVPAAATGIADAGYRETPHVRDYYRTARI
jgi:hypothetical protein